MIFAADIGGTKIAAALVAENGTILSDTVLIPTPTDRGAQAVLEATLPSQSRFTSNPNAVAARAALDELSDRWAKQYVAITGLWEKAWNEFIPFFDYVVGIRTVVCLTKANESLNARYPSAGRHPGRHLAEHPLRHHYRASAESSCAATNGSGAGVETAALGHFPNAVSRSIVVLLRVIDAVKTFALIQTMTKGGPGTSTLAISNYLYRLDDALADDTIDAVSLCTPDNVHFVDADKIMRAGRHLLLGKPIATDPDQAAALVATAESSAVVAMPGHTLRFEPRYHHAHQVTAAGVIGEVVHGYVRRNNRVSVAARANGRVNVAWFLGIHDIDALQWITGANVTDVQARETKIRDASGRQAAAVMATLGLPSGALVQLEAAWTLPDSSPTELDARFRLVGTTGELSIDSFDNGIRVAADRFDLPMPAGAPMYGRAQGPLHEELASFVQCCLTGAPLPITMREAAQAVMVVEALSSAVVRDQTVAVVQL